MNDILFILLLYIRCGVVSGSFLKTVAQSQRREADDQYVQRRKTTVSGVSANVQ